ncbi:multifunctional acyl-CoA thioesterase I/protease I/lysophospholipase L1 [Vibrio plantisponsor]|uniref:Multifunctional acyl-CoA thioesterase I/protease I/lysophospholipase L1 n=1 Tax=Vibrio plantisponsor TaxID=664643 RepID=A0ABU4IND3_9VIBR|nr:multifunctional acyl-CoA thioesterase I/protease I/lysophospholipase L1 [Vibrio plantisponsor]MDW6020083.1 multifunctional acyl-CoA thioesterase I/protease I/lysophospholipase L1 [Vibrio plantisponsor]NNM40916.1 multifunctional acyl-CoA thioesterase I/protease I/lysophospholipase L1 [Vibrio plantisponsor]PNH88179.1 multifunctional acyl-CoA thioesterase I/protease I/lysophospholipase L1 [Vibrio diazotrophicus]
MTRLLSLLLVVFFSTNASSNTLLVLGDSLSAGYNMSIEQAWPNLLGDALKNKGKSVTVINGSISGDTTGNGLSRLPSLLKQHNPDSVLIELGANDGLRGFPPQLVENNLKTMIDTIQAQNSQVILMQIRIPPNYGKRYSEAFSQLYPTIASEKSVPLIPFFLEQVIVKPEWMMQDGLHPKPDAQPWIADFMAEQLEPLL